MSLLSAEGFCEAECDSCGAIIGTENAMMNACSEPFNGAVITCNCGKEYLVNIGFKIEPL